MCSKVADPAAGSQEIVIDIAAVGICHTDISYLDGTLDHLLTHQRPITLCHEPVGVVCVSGSEVKRFAVGDLAGVPASTPNPPGTSIHGGFADKLLVPERLAIKIPEEISWVQAATAMDAGMPSYHAIIERGGLRPGMNVGIIGLGGGLGSLAAQVAPGMDAKVYVAG